MSPAAAGAVASAARCLLRDEGHQCRGPLSRTRSGQEKVMRTFGYVTAITMAAAGTALGLVAVRSLPEVRRYIAMRKM
jgi:hypothetical protein